MTERLTEDEWKRREGLKEASFLRKEIRNAVKKEMVDNNLLVNIREQAQEIVRTEITKIATDLLKGREMRARVDAAIDQQIALALGGKDNVKKLAQQHMTDRIREEAIKFVKDRIIIKVLEGAEF